MYMGGVLQSKYVYWSFQEQKQYWFEVYFFEYIVALSYWKKKIKEMYFFTFYVMLCFHVAYL
jgi:hypothetical protein